MDGKMKGKIVIVTGANSGIGKATAAQLADMGATVILACRSRERGEAALNELMLRQRTLLCADARSTSPTLTASARSPRLFAEQSTGGWTC